MAHGDKPGQDLLELVDLFKFMLSTGALIGGVITDAGGGNVDVTAGIGYAREADSKIAELFSISWSADTTAVADGTTRKIYVFYNAGTPILTSFEDTDAPNLHEYIYLGEAHYHGTTMTVHSDPRSAVDHTKHALDWHERIMKYRVENGLILSDPSVPSRNIAISAGTVFDSHLDGYDLPASDTSGSDTFTGYYRDGAGHWTVEEAETEWDNAKYDDGDGILGDMTDGYWSVRWIFMDRSGNVGVVYSQQEYPTFYPAREEVRPVNGDLPPQLGDHSFPVGHVVFQKGATSGTLIDSKPVIGDGYVRDREPTSSPKIFGLVSDPVTAPVDTVENILYSVVIPAGTLNANSVIRVRGSFSIDNSSNTKDYYIYFGDATPRLLNLTTTAPGTTLINLDGLIINRNSLSSQGYKPADAVLAGLTNGAFLTSSIDTAVDQTLSIAVQKTTAGNLIRLEYFIIEIL